jgi:adenine-specific DNA-methyltransferase
MADRQPTQPELFQVAELPGRPMLHWHSKRPLREIPYYPAQLRERYGPHPTPPAPSPLSQAWVRGEGWVNRLYWGDNLQVMAHLMREFRGKIKLIYIDPPFDSGADYRKRIKLRGTSVESDLSVLEERQYTDIWSNDLYLQYMYERLILMRELLAQDASLYLHCDPRRAHHLRCILDEVFGESNFQNEIVWKRQTAHSDAKRYGAIHDCILYYTRSPDALLETQYSPYDEEYVRSHYPYTDSHGRRFGTWDMTSPHPRPNMMYEWKGYPSPPNGWRYERETMERLDREGRIYYPEGGGRPRLIKYLDEMPGVPVQDIWVDIDPINSQALEALGYPTQKPEAFIERIITASSNPGDLVADFFIGSGTTAAVAQKLGRRWIGADINLGAIHTTAQRLARIIAEQQKTPHQPKLFDDNQSPIPNTQYPIFEVYNVNHYEVFKNAEEARDIVLKLYGVEPLKGHHFFDGTLDSRWVKVVDLNRICSRLDVQTIFDNLAPDDSRGVVVLCAGHEYDVPETIRRRNLLNVPFEVRDILTDRKDVIFKRPPEAQTRLLREDGFVTLTIEQFYSPLLLQKLSLEEDASTGSAQAQAIEDWRQTVASVLIDPAYDGEVFHARITDTPARRDELVAGEYTWEAAEYGDGPVAVKIVDVLDEEWFGVAGSLNH